MVGHNMTIPNSMDAMLFLTDDQLLQGIELMYFAYKGFTSDPDLILQ
ncbi:MAG: MarR family transcriptional regulator, partial [Amylibacter sp.]|nr:MarR family transcriptional regulator [Amylibacter sp.]